MARAHSNVDFEQARYRQREFARRAVTASNEVLSQANGHVLREAAPLVFQSMCRREGIRVLFTEQPKTDGRCIWLGPVDLTNPMAAVYVYGHGCHERHHVVHTDFSVVASAPSGAVSSLLNIFEDIRIDTLGAREYEGYLLWRDALLHAYESAGTPPWRRPADLRPEQRLEVALLMDLEVRHLGLTHLNDAVSTMVDMVDKDFGQGFFQGIRDLEEAAFPLASTQEALDLAESVWTYFREQASQMRGKFEHLDKQAQASLSQCLTPLVGQGSLFDMDGQPQANAIAIESVPGFADARNQLCAFNGAEHSHHWGEVNEKNLIDLREAMVSDESRDTDESIGALTRSSMDVDAYPFEPYPGFEQIAKEFHEAYLHSESMARLFQTALMHRVQEPSATAAEGDELCDEELYRLFMHDERLFSRPIPVIGRDMAVEILLDSSGSMGVDDMNLAKVVAARLFEALNATTDITATLSLFPGSTHRGLSLIGKPGDSIEHICSVMAPVAGFGPTPVMQALFHTAVTLDDVPEQAKLVFVVTDGWFGGNKVSVMLEALAERDIHVVTLAIGQEAKPIGDIVTQIPTLESAPRAVARLLHCIRDGALKHHRYAKGTSLVI